MYCQNCGSQIPDGAGFCYKCGAKLADNDLSLGAKESEQSKKRGNGFLRFIVIVALLVCACLSYLYFHPFLRELYVYSSTEVNANLFTESAINSNLSELKYTCVTNYNDEYVIFYPDNGMGLKYEKLRSEMEGTADITLRVLGDNAYLSFEFDGRNDSATIIYHKANLKERIYIAKQYLSW